METVSKENRTNRTREIFSRWTNRGSTPSAHAEFRELFEQMTEVGVREVIAGVLNVTSAEVERYHLALLLVKISKLRYPDKICAESEIFRGVFFHYPSRTSGDIPSSCRGKHAGRYAIPCAGLAQRS